MNKGLNVLVLVLIVFILFGCTSTSTKINVSDSNINIDINTSNTLTTGPVTHSIDIRNFTFTPSEITIKQGDIVIWRNYDSMGHTVTGGELDSQIMQNGMTFTYTFNNKGTIDYICTIHPSMKGKVIVQ